MPPAVSTRLWLSVSSVGKVDSETDDRYEPCTRVTRSYLACPTRHRKVSTINDLRTPATIMKPTSIHEQDDIRVEDSFRRPRVDVRDKRVISMTG